MEAKFVLLVVFVCVIVLSLFLTYIFSKPKVDITAELAKLNPTELTLDIVKRAECKDLEKHENYWIIKECKDGVYFKAFLTDTGYFFGFCSQASTQREKFMKIKDYFGTECKNLVSEDSFIGEEWGFMVYRICGLKVSFLDECVVGVREE